MKRKVKNKWKYLNIGLIIVSPVFFFGFLASYPAVGDGDAFYHAKIASVYASGQWIDHFDLLPLTILAESYTNHHFLYHVFLIPFVWIFDNPITAVKVGGVILASSTLLIWYIVAKKLQIVWASGWTLSHLFTAFAVRSAMVKAVPLALGLYFWGLLMLYRYNYKSIFFISVLLVWTYGGWPILPVTAVIYFVIHFVIKDKKIASLKLALSSILGASIGLIANPFFPQNLKFYKAQIIDIALMSSGDLVRGGEWAPVDPTLLLIQLLPFFILALTLIILFSINFYRSGLFISKDILAFGLLLITLTGGLLILTLISARYIEFFVPILILTIAWWFTHYLKITRRKFTSKIIWDYLWNNAMKSLVVRFYFIVTLFVLIFTVFFYYYGFYRQIQESYIPNNYAKKASLWVKNNIEQEAVIFNLEWGEYSPFYYNDAGVRFTFGLDPRLLSDTSLLNKWYDINQSTDPDPAKTMVNDFHADYALATQGAERLKEYYEKNGMVRIYEDDEIVIYDLPK